MIQPPPSSTCYWRVLRVLHLLMATLVNTCSRNHSDNFLLGVDPKADVNAKSNLRIFFLGLSWKGKIVLT